MTLTQPEQLNAERLTRMAERTYGHTLAITGVPVNAEGTLVWRSLDDVVRHPEAHGLLTAIETAVHLHRWTMMLNMDAFKRFPRLNIEFHATLDDVFTRASDRNNPTVWIHLGHGVLEHDLEEVHDNGELEAFHRWAPGLSQGEDDEAYISVTEVSQRIQRQQGDLLFVALPLCYGQQIAAVLAQSGRLHTVHAPTDFAVNATLKFYDGGNNATRLSQSLHSWSAWVKAAEQAWRDALLAKYDTGRDAQPLNARESLEDEPSTNRTR